MVESSLLSVALKGTKNLFFGRGAERFAKQTITPKAPEGVIYSSASPDPEA
jgi:hypothetical protein